MGFRIVCVIGIEIRLSAPTDRLTVHQDIQGKTGVLSIRVVRRLNDRQILEQKDRILDGINREGELNLLRSFACFIFPVAQTNRGKLAIRNGLRHISSTRFYFRTIEMHRMTTA